ncbi:MAG: sensor histidine kinase [Parasphingopyxis sp.]|nr:ATP-binding protein [Sphingomonadales bacterium]
MTRLGELDFPDRVSPALPAWAAQLLFAAICTLLPIVLRWAVDLFAFAADPFSLIYLGVLVATLFGRWQCGLLTLAASTLYAWYFVLPESRSFAFEIEGDGAKTVVNVLTLLGIVFLSEIFRRVARNAAAECSRQIADRELLLTEFDHRVRNNFANVTALLQLQLQRADNDVARDMLQAAIGRVEGIAQANRYLFIAGAGERICAHDYLNELCAALTEALFAGSPIELECDTAAEMISSDKAATIGLVVNELVTNAAKHAFPDGKSGRITVEFTRSEDCCRLAVADDGVGINGSKRPGSLGHRLMDALVQQLEGTLETRTGPDGTRVTLVFPAD